MPCYKPLHGYKTPAGGWTHSRSASTGKFMTVPCGQCLGCRLDRSRVWAIRLVHEAHMCERRGEESRFVTLTYREKNDPEITEDQLKNKQHIPDDGSLNKVHFQKFMKRLRKSFGTRKIRYYHCGEYGEKLERPHYHATLFNCSFPDEEIFEQREGNTLFTSKVLEELWGYGYVTLGEVTFKSAAYIARYILKKITGEKADLHYESSDADGSRTWLEPEYATMSRGLGADWFNEFANDVFPADETPVPGKGVIKQVPRFYTKLLEAVDPEMLEEIRARREAFRKKHAAEYEPERLEAKYRVKKDKVERLVRPL